MRPYVEKARDSLVNGDEFPTLVKLGEAMSDLVLTEFFSRGKRAKVQLQRVTTLSIRY